MDGVTHLYLVRHGATDANEQRPYILQGRGIDRSLSETGRRQAAAVAEFFQSLPVAAVYSSTMKRAVETARAIAGPHKLDVETDEALQECDVGRWEGMDWETIMREHADAYRAFIDDPATNPYLGGESYGDVLHRVRPVLDEFMSRHAGQSIVVVAHNVVNRVYLGDLLGLDMRRARKLKQTNTGVNVIRGKNGRSSLVTMNAHFHLNGPAYL